MATLRCGDNELPLTFTNHFLAHLQVAVRRRFANTTGGGGFFLTGTYAESGKGRAKPKEATVSHWLHPSVPLAFSYDIRDESDDRIPPIELDPKEIEAMLEAMDRAVGIHTTGDVWLTFRDKI